MFHRWLQVVKGNSIKFSPGQGPAVPQKCAETGASFLMGGPYWADPIHDMAWVNGILKSVQVRTPWIPLSDHRVTRGHT